jgi:hypothetical protein
MFVSCRGSRTIMAIMAALAITLPIGAVLAGHQFFRGNSVGGVSIDPAGVVREANVEALKLLLNDLRKTVRPAEADMNAPVEMRKISLRGLEQAIQEAVTNNFGKLPEEIQFLAGLQRIEYVYVDTAAHDIILAGPAEGWRIDNSGNVVGVTTGRPVLLLDDLLVALRTARSAQQEGISCSIDPTAEGVQRLQQVTDRAIAARNYVNLEQAARDAMGPQNITITGVPPNSHAARVMVSADFHMKRLAMDLQPAPVPGLPSYLDMMSGATNAGSAQPRWWLACNYESLARSEDGLIWKLRGPGVKAETEENTVADDGTITARRGATSPLAQKWADLMTEKYEALSGKMAIFGELRNLMDMCVVAAIIEMHDLRNQAGCELPLLYSASGPLAIESWNAPKTVDSVCSFVKTRKGFVMSTSGGVEIDSWRVADRSQVDASLDKIRSQVARSETSKWWWN